MEDIQVCFYESVEDDKIRFVVIVAEYQNHWIWVRHRERETYEIPGGHREDNERVRDAAVRELQEETGALQFTLQEIGVYSVIGKTRVNRNGEESFGMLYYARVQKLGELHSEIASIAFFDELPQQLTYPKIQPKLLAYVQHRLEAMQESEKSLDKI